MEEDIKLLKKITNCFITKEMAQAIENLINKYKEQEEQIEEYKLNVKEAMHEAQENARIFRKEQEKTNKYKKIINLMSEELAELNYEYCGNWCKGKKCKDYYENHFINEKSCNGNKLSCIIDYFKRKAKGE